MSGTRKINHRKKALRPKEEPAAASAAEYFSPVIKVKRSHKLFASTPRPFVKSNNNNNHEEAGTSPVRPRRSGIHSAISAAFESPDRRSNLAASSRSMSVANSRNTERSHKSHFGVTSANNRRTVKRNTALGPQTTRANQLNALRQAIQRQEAHQTRRRQRLKACIKRLEEEDAAEASRIRKMSEKLKTA
jgi:hypothetical protein